MQSFSPLHAFAFFILATSAFSAESLGQFNGQTDIGSPKLSGSATYDSAAQEYTLTGAGTNMWFGADQFHFVWKKMKGDFILRCRTEFIGKGAIVSCRTGQLRGADVGLAIELTQSFCRECRSCQNEESEGVQGAE